MCKILFGNSIIELLTYSFNINIDTKNLTNVRFVNTIN